MVDMTLNKLYVLDDIVYFRDYNFKTSTNVVSKLNLAKYIDVFMPELNKEDLDKIIENIRNNITIGEADDTEKEIISKINEQNIYSKDYAELVDEIIYYAREIYHKK